MRFLQSGKRVALWALAVAVVFALGVVWTGGVYTVTIVPFGDGPSQMVYRVNRLTGAFEIARCYLPAAGAPPDCMWSREGWY